MECKHKVSMSIDQWKDYEDDDSISFGYAKVSFLSTRRNSHRHVYTLDVLKEYAPTYLGKFLVAGWDGQDATTHVQDQKIVGYIPENQEVEYTQSADGNWDASVDVVISKIYAPEIYNLFKEKNYRAVSVEQLVGFAQEDENIPDGTGDKKVIGFEGIGITILGLSYKGSVPSANIKVIRMSEDSIQDMETEYVKYSNKVSNVMSVSMEDIMAKLDIIENKLSKEEVMPEELIETVMSETEETVVEETVEETVEMSADEVQESVEESTVETMADDSVAECAETEQCEETEQCGCKEEEMATEESEESAQENVEMTALMAELAEAKETICQYEAELQSLREFKEKVEMAEKESIVTNTLSQAKDYLDDDSYSKYEESGKACSYESITTWKNEVLASVAVKAMAKMSEMESKEKEEGITEIAIPQTETKKKSSIYD